jgi:hypothetical protein
MYLDRLLVHKLLQVRVSEGPTLQGDAEAGEAIFNEQG